MKLANGERVKRSEMIRMCTPIVAYVGPNGSGKTFCAVRDAVRMCELNPGRVLLSTSPVDHPAYIPLTSWRQLLTITNAEVILDEVSGVASARQYATLPAQLETRLQQLRKRNVSVRWTSPNFMRADVILREVSMMVVVAAGSYGRRPPGSPWKQHRMFRWNAYDCKAFEDFSAQKIERQDLKALCRQIYIRRDGDRYSGLYDSMAEVPTMDHVTITGTCLNCGGRRAQPKCSCPADHDVLEMPADETIPELTAFLVHNDGTPGVGSAEGSLTGGLSSDVRTHRSN